MPSSVMDIFSEGKYVQMQISVLASGSKGNCVYIEGHSGALLIDAGRSAREILGTKKGGGRLSEAGGDKDLIEAILITHEHGDHVKGLGPFGNQLQKPVFGTGGTLDACQRQLRSPSKFSLNVVKPGFQFETGGFQITPFAVSHDASEPCGYLIEEDSLRLCYCTDTGVVTPTMMEYLSQADGLVLESNHCPKMLKDGPYPVFLKRRISSAKGHLSNTDAGGVLRELSESLHLVILAHLSEENNDPDIALRNAHESLSFHGDHVDLFVASSIEGEKKEPIRKERGKNREICEKECWRYMIEL